MIKNIVIIGAGGVGRETSLLIHNINSISHEWNILGYVDDNESIWKSIVNGHPILGGIDFLNTFETEVYTVCTISDPCLKKKVLSKICNTKVKFAKLIHPTCIISEDCKMGEDVIIQANCVVTTNVTIGNHVQINPQCGIGHDSIIMDYSSLFWNVNISGNVCIGEGCTLGTKATVIQGLKIGDNSIIGAGAVVVRDLPNNCTAVGIPAKPIKFRK